MRRLVPIVTLLLAGCQSATSDALVQVRVRGELAGLRQLRMRATVEGRDALPVLFPAAPAEADLVLPRTAALRLPPGTSGQVYVAVDGLDGDGALIESRDGSRAVRAGDVIMLDVCFGVCVPEEIDAGVALDDAGMVIDAGPRPDGATPDSSVAGCGNSRVDVGEECDMGAGNDDVAGPCTRSCQNLIAWTRSYDAPAHDLDSALGVAVDSQGNVVVGGTHTFSSSLDIFLRKYDKNGGIVFTQSHGLLSGGDDIGRALAVNAGGDIYQVGAFWGGGGLLDRWLRKWTPTGGEGWTWTQNGQIGKPDELLGVAVDGTGEIIVVGYINQTVSTVLGDRDGDVGFIRKYSPNQDERWSDQLVSSSGISARLTAVTTDAQNNIYVTGFVDTGIQAGSEDLWLRKYNPGGVPLWTRTFNGAAALDDEGHAIAADATGVVVGGFSERAALNLDVLVRKWDASGNPMWTYTRNGTANGNDTAWGVVLDGAGNVYAAGNEGTGGGRETMWLSKLGPGGAHVWTRRDLAGGTSSAAQALARDPATGHLIVAGEIVTASGGQADLMVRKYAP